MAPLAFIERQFQVEPAGKVWLRGIEDDIHSIEEVCVGISVLTLTLSLTRFFYGRMNDRDLRLFDLYT